MLEPALAFQHRLRFVGWMRFFRGSRFLLLVLFLLLAGIIGPFLIWGERFDAALSLAGARDWMAAYGSWTWLAGILLLVSDTVLPVPSTIVMSALGLTVGLEEALKKLAVHEHEHERLRHRGICVGVVDEVAITLAELAQVVAARGRGVEISRAGPFACLSVT